MRYANKIEYLKLSLSPELIFKVQNQGWDDYKTHLQKFTSLKGICIVDNGSDDENEDVTLFALKSYNYTNNNALTYWKERFEYFSSIGLEHLDSKAYALKKIQISNELSLSWRFEFFHDLMDFC
jgi:hypothetical protein